MNVNVVMDWAKANAFTIVFVVIMLGAFIAMPFIAGGMNQDVRSKVQERANRLGQLAQLENTQIQLPGEEDSRRGVVTQHILNLYRDTVGLAREDAEAVYAVALERNRGDHRVLMPELFPAPPRHRAQILPQHFHEALMRAYDDLLAQLNVGEPPDPESVRQEIRLREQQFRGQILARDAGESLPEDEEKKLLEQLADLRLLQYQEQAADLTMYLSRDVLNLPRWEQARIPPLAELFEWQWRYWIHSDVLRALHRANGGSTLITSPVKHVLHFEFATGPMVGDASQRPTARSGGRTGGGSDGPIIDGGTGLGGGVGLGGPRRGTGGAATPDFAGEEDIEGPLGKPTINHRAAVAQDFSASFTGRHTNDLYDVRYVNLDVVVETARLPEVLDALTQQNFMTVTWLRITPADPYEAARDGCYYGSEPVSHVSMQIETVWLRSWTAEFMPASTRNTLGIASAPVGSPETAY